MANGIDLEFAVEVVGEAVVANGIDLEFAVEVVGEAKCLDLETAVAVIPAVQQETLGSL